VRKERKPKPKPENHRGGMMKIAVSQAATQLGIAEEVYRLAMTEAGIKDAENIAEIDIDAAAMIAETVNAQASNQALLPSTDRPLPVPVQEQIITGVQSVLADFSECIDVQPEQVSTAIAYLKAIRSAQAYQQTFVATFKHEVGQFNLELQSALLQSVSSVDVSKMTQDFLKSRGVKPHLKDSVKSQHLAVMTEIENLINQVK